MNNMNKVQKIKLNSIDKEKATTLKRLSSLSVQLARVSRYVDKSNLTFLRNFHGKDYSILVNIKRQKPSVQAGWDFDEEAVLITKEGKVIVGFDSGCSCPSPFVDNYPECYEKPVDMKTFIENYDSYGFDDLVPTDEMWCRLYQEMFQAFTYLQRAKDKQEGIN